MAFGFYGDNCDKWTRVSFLTLNTLEKWYDIKSVLTPKYPEKTHEIPS